MPEELVVPPREWLYVHPLIILADYIRERTKGQTVTRHKVTKVLRELVDFATGKAGKAATVARMMDILSRDFGFASEEQRETVANAVKRLVEEVSKLKSTEPQKVLPFIRNLRILLLGLFYGYVKPVRLGEKELKGGTRV